MKRFSFLCLVILMLAFTTGVYAQDAKAYKNGPVTNVSYIRTKPGQFDAYVKWLDGPYKKNMEAQKKAGLVTSYAVYATQPRTAQDPDLILTVIYPNMAALDKTDESDAVAAKVLGSNDEQDKATVDRGSIREVLGGRLMREMILK